MYVPFSCLGVRMHAGRKDAYILVEGQEDP